MSRYFLTLLILGLIYLSTNLNFNITVQAQNTPNEVLGASQPIHTTSRFESKLQSSTQKLERPITYRDDPESEIGNEVIVSEGADGEKTTIERILFYEGQEYSRELVSTEVKDPQPKIIKRGTKIIWRDLDTPDGTISYWRTMRVWATQYDSHCNGCDETTATGLRAGKGVIAVDPSVIKLGSKVYIPGYGIAIAGDTGGSIKGSIVDLGFESTATSGWSSHFVNIYLLNGV